MHWRAGIALLYLTVKGYYTTVCCPVSCAISLLYPGPGESYSFHEDNGGTWKWEMEPLSTCTSTFAEGMLQGLESLWTLFIDKEPLAPCGDWTPFINSIISGWAHGGEKIIEIFLSTLACWIQIYRFIEEEEEEDTEATEWNRRRTLPPVSYTTIARPLCYQNRLFTSNPPFFSK